MKTFSYRGEGGDVYRDEGCRPRLPNMGMAGYHFLRYNK